MRGKNVGTSGSNTATGGGKARTRGSMSRTGVRKPETYGSRTPTRSRYRILPASTSARMPCALIQDHRVHLGEVAAFDDGDDDFTAPREVEDVCRLSGRVRELQGGEERNRRRREGKAEVGDKSSCREARRSRSKCRSKNMSKSRSRSRGRGRGRGRGRSRSRSRCRWEAKIALLYPESLDLWIDTETIVDNNTLPSSCISGIFLVQSVGIRSKIK
eukprot:753942-Hanusia_phi.AAC.3